MLLELSFPEVMSLITNRWVSQGKMSQKESHFALNLSPWELWEEQGEREAYCAWPLVGCRDEDEQVRCDGC